MASHTSAPGADRRYHSVAESISDTTTQQLLSLLDAHLAFTLLDAGVNTTPPPSPRSFPLPFPSTSSFPAFSPPYPPSRRASQETVFVDWDGEGDFVLRYREQPQQQQEEEDPIPRPAATMCHGSESASCRINQPFDYSPAVPRPPIAHARYHAAAGQDHRAPVHEPVLAGWCGADYDGGRRVGGGAGGGQIRRKAVPVREGRRSMAEGWGVQGEMTGRGQHPRYPLHPVYQHDDDYYQTAHPHHGYHHRSTGRRLPTTRHDTRHPPYCTRHYPATRYDSHSQDPTRQCPPAYKHPTHPHPILLQPPYHHRHTHRHTHRHPRIPAHGHPRSNPLPCLAPTSPKPNSPIRRMLRTLLSKVCMLPSPA